MKKIFLIAFTLFLGVGLFGFTEKSTALTISPPVKEILGNPGETVSGMIKIYNETNTDTTVYSSVSDFTAKEGEGGEPKIFEATEADDRQMSKWVKVTTDPIGVKSLDWQNILFEIQIPSNAEPGGHYAAIFFGPFKDDLPRENAVSVNYKTGSLILLTVAGDIREEGKIENFSVKDDQKFFEHLPVNLELRIKNTGNVHFKPGGFMTMTNMFGGKILEIPVVNTNSGGNVLPNSIRRYNIIWGEENNLSQNFWEKVKYEWKNFYMGKYSSEVTVALPQGKTESRALAIWIIPWQLLVVMLLVMVVLYWLFRTYNRWIIKKAREDREDKA